jgi:phosphoribosylformylglycinamidine synthase
MSLTIGVVDFIGNTHNVKNYKNLLENNYDCKVNILKFDQNEIDDENMAVIIPAGNSYMHLPYPGAIASNSKIINAIKDFVKKGYYVLGIDNGFHILCASGLLPGNFIMNKSAQIESMSLELEVKNSSSIFSGSYINNHKIEMSISTLYGSYLLDEETKANLYEKDQVAFCVKNNSEFNKNIGENEIIAVLNSEKNVMGILTLPEENFYKCNEDSQGGKTLFDGLVNCLVE